PSPFDNRAVDHLSIELDGAPACANRILIYAYHGAGVFKDEIVGPKHRVDDGDLPGVNQQLCGVPHAVSSFGEMAQASVVIKLRVDAVDRRRKVELAAC